MADQRMRPVEHDVLLGRAKWDLTRLATLGSTGIGPGKNNRPPQRRFAFDAETNQLHLLSPTNPLHCHQLSARGC